MSTILLVFIEFFAQPVRAQLDNPDLIQTFLVRHYPWGMTYDGANIWVANTGSYDVAKLRASDGILLGHFKSGGGSACAPQS